VFSTGQGRKTDPVDAHSVALVGLHSTSLRMIAADDATVALRLLADRRDELGVVGSQTINRVHRLLPGLLPGGARKFLSAAQAKELLAGVRPRDIAGKTRRRLAAQMVTELTQTGPARWSGCGCCWILEHTQDRLAETERRMTAVLDELGLTGLVTSMKGLSAICVAAILAETSDPRRFAAARAAGQACRRGPAGEDVRRVHRQDTADRAGTTRAAAGSLAGGLGSPAR
jgi:transposase